MKTSAKMVMMSHLSDVQFLSTLHSDCETQELNNQENIRQKLNFVKYLIDNCMEGRLSEEGIPQPNHKEIDPDEMFTEFLVKFPYKR